ncbi:hypothetical protein [uncultured Roseovarius sp.]|uniref:hypothetical protein n=1 Tax=uncultured Roseovarius sp. TaxID=293344 RepID=UPI00262E136C|nr:hypothetical protein [uncultured Roseovarius sp.]
MKKVTHEAETVAQDAMGKKNVIKISIPLVTPETDEDVITAFANVQSGIAQAFEDAERLRDPEFPRNVRDAFHRATDAADSDAAPLTMPYEMYVVSQGLEQALDILETVPDDLKYEMEEAVNAAFTAGSNYRNAISRERHLDDLERELSQSKARERGRAENRRNSLAENQDLFEYMHPLVQNPENKVLTIARWAVKKGYGSQTGDLEKDAKANRSRYNRWVSGDKER